MKKINKNKKGASLVEYGLLVALIAIVTIVAVTAMGRASSQKLKFTADKMNYN